MECKDLQLHSSFEEAEVKESVTTCLLFLDIVKFAHVA